LFTNAFASMRYSPNQKINTTALMVNPMIHAGTSELSAYPATNRIGITIRATRITVQTRRQIPSRASGTLPGRRRNSRIAVGATPAYLSAVIR
jgi:hypothetical protein